MLPDEITNKIMLYNSTPFADEIKKYINNRNIEVHENIKVYKEFEYGGNVNTLYSYIDEYEYILLTNFRKYILWKFFTKKLDNKSEEEIKIILINKIKNIKLQDKLFADHKILEIYDITKISNGVLLQMYKKYFCSKKMEIIDYKIIEHILEYTINNFYNYL